MASQLAVSVLLKKSDDAWYAQCLEYDVAAQGPNVAEVKNRFLKTLMSQIAFDMQDGKLPLSGLPSAPRHCFDLLSNAVEDGPALPVWVPKDAARVRVHFLRIGGWTPYSVS